MEHRLKLALIAAAIAFSPPAWAGGSMANPVKVIIVKRPDAAEQLRKEFAKRDAAEAKAKAKDEAARAKAWAAAEKARAKKKKK